MGKSKGVDFRLIKERVTIDTVLDHYGLLEGMKRQGNRIYGVCPIHGSGRNPAQFQVKLDENLWFCFGDCHRGGSVLDLVSAMENVSILRAGELLSEWFGIKENGYDLPADTSGKSNDGRVLPLGIRLDLEPEHPYLQGSRGISRETAEHFGIGYCRHGLMAGRIAIPLHDENGVLVGYCGRSVDGTEPKYLFPPGIKKGKLIYNYRRAKERMADKGLIVVEGFFDVFHLYQVGNIHNVVALMGSRASPYQLDLLSRAKKIILLMDGDEAGRRGEEQIAIALKSKTELHSIRLPEGKEPENLTKSEIGQILIKCGMI